MRRARFSVASGMAVVLLVAIGSAALTHPTALWASSLFTLTVVLLCWASALALVHRACRPAFWVGFATFGWIHLILSFGLFGVTSTISRPLPPPPRLLSANLMDFLDQRVMPASPLVDNTPINPYPPYPAQVPGLPANAGPFQISFLSPLDLAHTEFHQIGYSTTLREQVSKSVKKLLSKP